MRSVNLKPRPKPVGTSLIMRSIRNDLAPLGLPVEHWTFLVWHWTLDIPYWTLDIQVKWDRRYVNSVDPRMS